MPIIARQSLLQFSQLMVVGLFLGLALLLLKLLLFEMLINHGLQLAKLRVKRILLGHKARVQLLDLFGFTVNQLH